MTSCPPGQVVQDGVCFACLGPAKENCGPSTQEGPAQKPKEEGVAPKPTTPAPPQVVAPKTRITPKAVAAQLHCPDGTTAAATAGCPIPATGVPAGWVQRNTTMFPVPK